MLRDPFIEFDLFEPNEPQPNIRRDARRLDERESDPTRYDGGCIKQTRPEAAHSFDHPRGSSSAYVPYRQFRYSPLVDKRPNVRTMSCHDIVNQVAD